MKIAGVIAEYNPFHNGHKYQLDEIRRKTGADYIIIAMSGNFVQRGVPALLDKYTRAEMALCEGADLVLELPFLYASSSAEMFALGGVSLLRNTGIVQLLCFGAESDDLTGLKQIAQLLSGEPDDYRTLLRRNLSKGSSFPAARQEALEEYTGKDLSGFLRGSNNLLAIEYLKQLCTFSDQKFSLEPVLIPRKGDAYRSKEISGCFASATAIRELLRPAKDEETGEEAETVEPAVSDKPQVRNAPGLLEIVPDSCVFPLLMAKKQNSLIYEGSLSEVLAYKILSDRYSQHTDIADCSPELCSRIFKSAEEFRSYSQYCQLIKNKSITYSHVSHALINLLFDVTEEEYLQARRLQAPYLRVLGFRKESSGLLSLLQKKASVPVITSVASGLPLLTGPAAAILHKDLYTSDFYNQLVYQQSGIRNKNDYSHPMVII